VRAWLDYAPGARAYVHTHERHRGGTCVSDRDQWALASSGSRNGGYDDREISRDCDATVWRATPRLRSKRPGDARSSARVSKF